MISVMVSKWVADAFGQDGIYASWSALRRYPWLAPFEFRDNGEIAADAMTPVNNLIVLHDGSPLGELSKYRTSRWRIAALTRIVNRKITGNVGVPRFSSCRARDVPWLRGTGEARQFHRSVLAFVCSVVLDQFDNPLRSASPLREWRGNAHRQISWATGRRFCRPIAAIGGHDAVTERGTVGACRKHVPQTGKFSLLLPIELFSRPVFLFVELAAHHILAGRRTDRDDHQNGRRSLVDSSLSPLRRSLRGEGHSQQIIIDISFVFFFKKHLERF